MFRFHMSRDVLETAIATRTDGRHSAPLHASQFPLRFDAGIHSLGLNPVRAISFFFCPRHLLFQNVALATEAVNLTLGIPPLMPVWTPPYPLVLAALVAKPVRQPIVDAAFGAFKALKAAFQGDG